MYKNVLNNNKTNHMLSVRLAVLWCIIIIVKVKMYIFLVYLFSIVIVVSAYVKFIFEVLPLVSSYHVNLAVTVFLCGSAVLCVLVLLKT